MLQKSGCINRVSIQQSLLIHQILIYRQPFIIKKQFLQKLFIQNYETKLVAIWYVLRDKNVYISSEIKEFLYQPVSYRNYRNFAIINFSNDIMNLFSLNPFILSKLKLRINFMEDYYYFIKNIFTKLHGNYFLKSKLNKINSPLFDIFFVKTKSNLTFNLTTYSCNINLRLNFIICYFAFELLTNYTLLINCKFGESKILYHYGYVYIYSNNKINALISQIGVENWVNNQIDMELKLIYNLFKNGFILYELYILESLNIVKYFPSYKTQIFYTIDLCKIIQNNMLIHYDMLIKLRVHRLIWLKKFSFSICDSEVFCFINYKINNIIRIQLINFNMTKLVIGCSSNHFIIAKSFKFCNICYNCCWVLHTNRKNGSKKLYLPQLHWFFI